jgi:hypothetical protein
VSLGLTVYLVSERDVTAVLGCRDDALLGDVLEQMAQDFDDLEEQFSTDDPEYGPGLTFAEALRELFQGRLSRPRDCDFVYTYAFEEICRYYDKGLSKRWFDRCSTEWVEHLDGLLARGGVPLRFHDLCYRCPVQAPPYRDVLRLGHWTRAEAVRAVPLLERLLSQAHREGERNCLEEACGWLAKARAQPGSVIIGVYC